MGRALCNQPWPGMEGVRLPCPKRIPQGDETLYGVRVNALLSAYHKRSAQCKPCVKVSNAVRHLAHRDTRNAQMRAWRKANPERMKALQDAYYQAHCEQLREYKRQVSPPPRLASAASRPLQRRGERLRLLWRDTVGALGADHDVNGGGTQHRNASGSRGSRLYLWLEKNGYPEGFRVLCHNCNMALGFYGYCPHEREQGGAQTA